ncbi:uncharacterized protein VICG_00760 [Vittaforma corneae ATCC 50505]|uniref:Uncharacterized protein n=1 Tax=Vittaforma corneae (strain ATCC 50505) TaxID=993615 RepID=L2GNE2_VITCO|nr:uncharacterized protein VICG_00760 [Vittaforma corneae ATCC 50505]ELA42119.1 hypothetical protein VICG_00760 [Vittaforma corneae ATCC 50505]
MSKKSEEKSTAVEPLLDPSQTRYVLFPIQYHDIWHYYKKAESSSGQSRKWTYTMT